MAEQMGETIARGPGEAEEEEPRAASAASVATVDANDVNIPLIAKANDEANTASEGGEPTEKKRKKIEPMAEQIGETIAGGPGEAEEPRAASAASVATVDANDVNIPLIDETNTASGGGESSSLSQPKITPLWFGGVRYDNPWDTWRDFWRKIVPVIKWKCCNLPNFPPSVEDADRELPIKGKEEILKEIDPINAIPEPNQVRVTWLGHAFVLLQFNTATILCDPVFSDRIGPIKLPGVSYPRYRKVPLEVEDLPPIDAVVISHNHYDHLDLDSVKDLNEHFAEKIKWFVPKGLKAWMCGVGIKGENVEELMWWEETELEGKDVKLTFTPTQHWCVRNGFDKNKSLWGSWAICTSRVKTWFGGDTGYCKTFEEIGEKFDGFDFAAIPIGAFLPRDVMRDQHVEPKESVQIHKDLKCKKSLGIHWGTFTMGCIEPFMEPKLELEKERTAADVPEEDFFVLDHGESKLITSVETIPTIPTTTTTPPPPLPTGAEDINLSIG